MVYSFVFVYRFRGLWIQLGSLDTDRNGIGTYNTKYVWRKEISTRKILQPENVTAWTCALCFPKQAPGQMSASPQKWHKVIFFFVLVSLEMMPFSARKRIN